MLLNWWNTYLPLNSADKEIVKINLSHDLSEKSYIEPKFNTEAFKSISMKFFDKMLASNCTIDNSFLTFEVSATTFIKKLFARHVDEDTLIITSNAEHPSVKNIINEYKNVLEINQYNDIRAFNFHKIQQSIKQYKKVFVYIIGTQNATGEITPQEFFVELKNLFIKNNVQHILILDDVQGMFLVPRDYTLFDYVIGTAHAVCMGFDMGILISKQRFPGIDAYNWGELYLKRLEIVTSRANKFNLFRALCIQYYSKYIKNLNKISRELVVPYIFYLRLKEFNISENSIALCNKINLLITKDTDGEGFISLRSHWFINDDSLLPKCLKIIDKALTSNLTDDFIQQVVEGD